MEPPPSNTSPWKDTWLTVNISFSLSSIFLLSFLFILFIFFSVLPSLLYVYNFFLPHYCLPSFYNSSSKSLWFILSIFLLTCLYESYFCCYLFSFRLVLIAIRTAECRYLYHPRRTDFYYTACYVNQTFVGLNERSPAGGSWTHYSLCRALGTHDDVTSSFIHGKLPYISI
jgi:hypothetical protein